MPSPGNSDISQLRCMMPNAWSLFFHRRGPRPIQEQAIPHILKGESVFLTAPTASGKTEAAIAPLYQRHVSFKRSDLSVLYVAPTKALVNDIYYRLSDYLGAGRESTGVCRYTGDHHDFKEPAGAFVLVATPEALDSLQLTKPEKLAHIRAVVIDEVHFIHGKARGEQLRYVLARIRSKAKPPKDPRDKFQIVAMSATLNDMEQVGRLWAGDEVRFVAASDSREIEMEFVPIPDGKLESQAGLIAPVIQDVVERSSLDKILIFTNSRNDAHLLSIALNETFRATRWPVHLHFGILEASVRDTIEADLRSNRYGICVATSTLELGIDIGDIQTIMLLSPPPTVSSFLQRIGRGNRRTGTCRVVALVRNDSERLLYQALLELARSGNLEPVHEYHRPSVGFQQVISHAWQGMRADSPLSERNLTTRGGGKNLSDVLHDMLDQGHLRANQGALLPSDQFIEQGDRRTIHTVLAGDGAKPVYDGVTGDAVASFGAGAGEGVYFLGGQLRRIANADRSSYVLERVGATDARHVGKIPAARGGRGMSRTLAWKIAELSGIDPRAWSWNEGRLVTWGGWENNLLLSYLLPKHGLGNPSGFDGFGLDGLMEDENLTPTEIADLIRQHRLNLQLKEAEKFREPTRFYSYLGTAMKTREAMGAVPVAAFEQWLAECDEEVENGESPAEPSREPTKNDSPVEPEDDAKKNLRSTNGGDSSTHLELHLTWNATENVNSARKFAEHLISLFIGTVARLALNTERMPEHESTDLTEIFDLLRKEQFFSIRFFLHPESAVSLLSLDLSGSKATINIPGDMRVASLLTSGHDLHWFQCDSDCPTPLPVLALPVESTCIHPAALHGLVALAKLTGELTSATLKQGDDPLAHWFISPPSGDSHPVAPVVGDHLWLAASSGQHDKASLWLQFLALPKDEDIPNFKDLLDPLVADDIPDPAAITNAIKAAFPQLSIEVRPLVSFSNLNTLSEVQKETILALSPTENQITLALDFCQPPSLLVPAILHAVGHCLLGHVRRGDRLGHADTEASILGKGTLRRWDREVRENSPNWFTVDVRRRVETLAECTTEEKAMLGLWRMIGEMLGESRRLHPRAEAYQQAAYQRQAAQRLLAQMEEFGGAMLCDGVGLGKTYVATTIMVHYANVWRDKHQDHPEELLADPFRISILAPNSVVSTWQREALPSLAAHGLPLATVRVISHTRLSRISKTSEILEPLSRQEISDMEHLLLSDFVIVDEAHNFRSLNARRSVVLRDLLRLQPRREQRRRALLLTATPINNTLDDLLQETALLFSKPLWLSNAVTDDGYRRQAVKEINDRCIKARSPKGPKGDVAPLLIHGQADARFSQANDFRDDLDFGPNVQRIGDYLREQDQKLRRLQQEIRDRAENGGQGPTSEPARIAEELLDRIVVQRSRNLCKEIERQQGANVELLFRADAGLPEKLRYSDEYDGTRDILAGFLPLFDRGEDGGLGQEPLSLKVYMWYDVREGIKTADDISPVVGLQRILVLKRLESSPVSFLITLLRLTVLHAYRLQNLIDLCAKASDHKRTQALKKKIERTLAAHETKDLNKILTLATTDASDQGSSDFLSRLARAYEAKMPAAEINDAPLQLSLFDQGDSSTLSARQELERLWGLKDYLLQDFSTLLHATPGLADVVFGRFDRTEWPHHFTRGGEEVAWPQSPTWGMRMVSDAKLRSLVSRLLQARRAGQKVIVFSQFSDTLAYAHSVLRAASTFTATEWRMALPALGLPDLKDREVRELIKVTEVITGSTEDRDEVVNAFAPYYRIGPFPPPTGEDEDKNQVNPLGEMSSAWASAWENALCNPIHVLFSSDVLAEGVNLQDVAVLINFDVHWNPVRMIQRSGRIDRRLNPRIEKAHAFPELESLSRGLKVSRPSYYWHGRDEESPLTVNMILPDELETELLLRERIAMKTLAIDFTLGLDQGTGAEADWMADYAYQGVSSLNAFQRDRAIEQVAGFHEKFSRIFKERGMQPEWAAKLDSWFRAVAADVSSPLVARALLGRRGEPVDRFERCSRYLEPRIKDGTPYWCWAEKIPGESLYDGWLIMDGRAEHWPPPPPSKGITFHKEAAGPVRAAHLLAAALQLEQGVEIKALPPQEFVKPFMQGATALAAPKLGAHEDRVNIGFNDVYILQLPVFDPEKLGRKIS